jgi:thioredoxin-dependent peroxiredoxin
MRGNRVNVEGVRTFCMLIWQQETQDAMSDTLNLKQLAEIPLHTDEGKPINLADFVFPRADTPGCTAQACGFRDNFPKITDAGAVVFGLSNDQPKALANWKVKQKLPYTLLSDPEHKLIEKLGAWGERSMFGRKFTGTVRSHFVFNENGDLTVSELRVNPADSVREGVNTLISTK